MGDNTQTGIHKSSLRIKENQAKYIYQHDRKELQIVFRDFTEQSQKCNKCALHLLKTRRELFQPHWQQICLPRRHMGNMQADAEIQWKENRDWKAEHRTDPLCSEWLHQDSIVRIKKRERDDRAK